ncbi:class I SAM-dependent methyltransferase [Arcobacter sp.]|uniref:class I SAM-dependent methyltransferase n=1 Tax=Arcobacter sp. TaxID=1872629 RepID=UPI003D0DEA59
MNRCKICDSQKLESLYRVENLPLFQNKVYNSFEEARSQKVVNVDLCQCQECGFVFNNLFTNENMDYDDSYQNEQNYSQYFVDYLNEIADYLIENNFQDKKIVEIGCGKGYFTELLEKKGFKNIYGFDPAYEGNNPNITKDYFNEKYKSINADLIILRHVLEHIEKPYEFLTHIQNATFKDTKILIEVPDFEWIVKNKAFWDIFYEHCNYFDNTCLSSFFKDATTRKVFGSQYLLMLASLNELSKPSVQHRYPKNIFENSFKNIKEFLSHRTPLALWGGSSKGVTLLNIFDKNKQLVEYCIDINPKKQAKFIATTGHEIVPPKFLTMKPDNISILIVNQNYYEEIVKDYCTSGICFYSLEKIINEKEKND